MYDKYSMKLRVHWPESGDLGDVGDINNRGLDDRRTRSIDSAHSAPDDSALLPVVQQLQQVLTLQQELILQSAAAQAAAEERAEQAEARALAAERECLEALRAAQQGSDAS